MKRLRQEHLPLAEIRAKLGELTDHEISTLVAAEEPVRPSTSALDYIRTVLGPRDRVPANARAPQPPQSYTLGRLAMPLIRATNEAPGLPEWAATPRPSQSPAEPQPIERSQWEHLSLGPNIELHVRRPLSRLENKRVERLITIARQVLKEDTP
jgi:hypothetical protein